MRALILATSIAFLFVHSLFGQEARDIIEKSHEATRLESFEAVSTLTIKDSRGNSRVRQNTMASKLYPGDVEKRIIKFLSPAEVKGTGILIIDNKDTDDDMWIYLPALRKTRRIVSNEKSKSFMGSEFSNADMTAPSLSEFEYQLLGSETINGKDCYKIASVPLTVDLEDQYGYSMSVSWINKNDYIVQRRIFFDFDEEHYKTIETISYKLLDPANKKYMITEMNAENLQSGRSSLMVMDEVQLSETKDEYFSTSYLER